MPYFYNENAPSSDLACERYRADLNEDGVKYEKEVCSGGFWERIEISSVSGAKSIGRPMGFYDTLNLDPIDTLDTDEVRNASREIADELLLLVRKMHIIPKRLLVVGLGNPSLTPDSIGVRCADGVRATMHIRDMDEAFFNAIACSEIAVIQPGVKSKSGIDASDTVLGICGRIKPNAVIAIDALAALSAERLGKTVQLSSTGIIPGSGVGNHRSALDEDSLGVPVISVGVPTVISAKNFCLDLTAESSICGNSMLVAPKEIDEIARVSGDIISGGINLAFGICT